MPPKDGVRFLQDKFDSAVTDTATSLGLQPVGWIVAAPERAPDKKYGGKPLLSAAEVAQAAQFQRRFRSPGATGPGDVRSRFVTIVLEHADNVPIVSFPPPAFSLLVRFNEYFTIRGPLVSFFLPLTSRFLSRAPCMAWRGVPQIEPCAYQVSDQCVALERDGCFGKAEVRRRAGRRATHATQRRKQRRKLTREWRLPSYLLCPARCCAPAIALAIDSLVNGCVCLGYVCTSFAVACVGCVLVRAQDPFMMSVRKLGKDEMGPKIVYHDHPLEQGDEFLPDDFIVKVILMTASKNAYLFAHNGHFPSLPFASDLHVMVRTRTRPAGRPAGGPVFVCSESNALHTLWCFLIIINFVSLFPLSSWFPALRHSNI